MMKKIVLSAFAVLVFVNYTFALSLSGKVVNIYTNEGQQNVKITVTNNFDEFKVNTDSDGMFILSGLKNNTIYNLHAETAENSLVFPKNSIIQTKKADIKDLNLTYYSKYSVSGTVNSENFKTSGLQIMFKSGKPFYDTALATIDETGRYKADGLIYGQEYDAYISSNFSVYGVLGDNSVTISDNSIKNMKIVPVFYGTGMVYDASSKMGFKDIVVKAVSSDGLYEHTATTAADGSFILKGLYYGENYTITSILLPDFESTPSEIRTGKITSTVTDLNFSIISK